MENNKKGKGLIIILLVVILILVLGYGIVIGFWASGKLVLNNVNSTNNATNTAEVQKAKVSRIEHESCSRPDHDGTFYILITAYDDSGKEVWTYKTEEGATTQYLDLNYIGENNGRVYVEECGTIVALNRENGEVVWKNSEYKGFDPIVEFDSKGNMYIGSYSGPGPKLFIISKDGKTLVNDVTIEGMFGKLEIDESNNQLVAYYYVPTEDVYYYNNVLTMNLSDYTYTIKKQEPEIITYERENVEGALYIINKDDESITFDLQVSTAVKGQEYPNGNVNVGKVSGFAYKTDNNTYEMTSSNTDNSKQYSLIFEFIDDTVVITETGDFSIESGYFGLNASAPGTYKKTK